MESYVIRIYRRKSHDITGLVEQVEMNEQRPFACFDELRDILTLRHGKAAEPRELQIKSPRTL